MAFVLHYKRGERLAVAEVTGLAFIEDAYELVQQIEALTREDGTRRLLINLLDVVGTLEAADHEALGRLAFQHLSHLEKVASFVPEDKVTHVSEKAATALGLQLRVFSSLTDAMTWLVA